MTNNIISENNPLTILVYSPYSQAMPHVLHEITIAKSLQLRGANVIYICCDKFYSVCDANWERWGKKNEDSCRLCMAQAKSRLELYEIKHEWLSSYIDQHTVSSIYQWINNLPIDQLRMCSYKDYAVGGYGLASLCSHYRLSNLDMKEPHIINTYKNYIAGSALAIDALTEALDVHKPDVILMFNGRFFSHNILLRLAKQRGITAYIHERSSIKDTILFKYNGNILVSEQSKNHWKAWEDIPLSSGEVNCIDDYLAQRKLGNNTGCLSISHAKHDVKFIYETLNISQNSKIITLFTSSTDEFIGNPGLKFIINQTDLIKRAISFFKDKIEYCLVIRVHPNATESDITNTDMAALKDSLPPNVKILYPDDKISSYKLIEVSNANIVFMSSIGIEAAAMGKPVLMCSDISSFYGHRYSLNLPDADSCEEYIELLLSEVFSIERIRAAYRHAYFIFFRRCIPFPLVNSYETYKAKVCYPSNDLLIPGYDESLDRVCEAILNKRSADQFPDELLNYSRKDEDDFLDRKLGITRRDTNGNTLIQKILFVCHNIPPYEFSGTPIITHTQAREMLRRGKEVAVLIPSQEVSGKFYEETAPDGLRIFKIPKIDRRWSFFEELHNPASVEKHLDMVKEILRKFKPDVIHVNDYVDMPVLIFEAFAASKAIVVREIWNDEEICFRVSPIIEETHEVCSGPESIQKCMVCHGKTETAELPELERKLSSHHRYIRHLYENVVDGVVFSSSMFKEHFTRFIPVPETKTTTIACAIETSPRTRGSQPAAERKTTTFTFMGNFFEFRKGLDVLLRACLMLGPTPGIKVKIFGQGRNDALEEIQRISALTNGMIEYHGRYSSRDLPEIMKNTDVGIVTSYFESYCLVLREFLSCGIPVLSTRFCGSEIIDNGRNGYVIDLGDARALAEKMKGIASDGILLQTLSKGAEKTIIPSADREAESLLDFYAALASQKGDRPQERPVPQDSRLLSRATDDNPWLIAFHLPQYHPIPENDAWWGEGFTEWTNVAKAQPIFDGHYQPHVPAQLGYYDLRTPSTMKAQADLAREYGIHGFCFYHYWFNGKLLLETPLHQMLQSGQPDFPFCLCWANEDWTRVWDGKSGEILIRQDYNDADDTAHMEYLLQFFRDGRYIRINGKPLFLVYRASKMPDPKRTTDLWRDIARREGIGELYLCRIESSSEERIDPSIFGFDAAVEFQPDWNCLPQKQQAPAYGKQHVYKYDDFRDNVLGKIEPSYVRHPCVLVSWDNSPRRENGIAQIFIESNPANYGKWLRETVDKVNESPRAEKLVFINAWNEWGEGNHLEPDEKYGTAYLEATKAAVDRESGQKPTVAIKVCTPSRNSMGWGDTFFGDALARAFERLGYACRVDCRDKWYTGPDTDMVIHLKGLYTYTPSPSSHNIIWIISHPELVTVEELNSFDVVFCASESFSRKMGNLCTPPVHYLPQATEPDIFKPVGQTKKEIDLLFVGNNYEANTGGCRKIIEDLLKTGKDYNYAVVGQQWRGVVDDARILGDYVEPRQLPLLYSMAGIVLNDHHREMRREGFINNRTYDLALSGVCQISDHVEGMEEISVVTYDTPEDLRNKIDYFLGNAQARETAASLAHDKCRSYTFDTRASEIIRHALTTGEQARGSVCGRVDRDATRDEKGVHEFAYWSRRKEQEGVLSNDHYEKFYTELFGLDKQFYAGKRILDIGCGPRGSLEWADNTTERIGLDPLADEYKKLNEGLHSMRYVSAPAERIPFEDGYFDVVCSFNSLDHVDDLSKSISEIKRILAPGGVFLLLTDVNHQPTECEPIVFSWDVVKRFGPEFTLSEERFFEKDPSGIYASTRVPYDFGNPNPRAGVLCAKFVKPVAHSPFISVLIPTYNRARYLADAISSALSQEYENFEVVVVDDGSTDETAETARSLSDPRLRYVIKEHSGAPATRNRCIAEAKGDFVLWLDSDDRLLPGVLQTYANTLKTCPSADVVYGDLEITDTSFTPTHSLKYPDWFGHNQELLAHLFMKNAVPNPGTLVRKACYQAVGGYDESFRRAHDYQWWIRAAKSCSFKHSGMKVVQWRWHDSNMSSGTVKFDKSFDAEIAMSMLRAFSLAELFPKLDWSAAPDNDTRQAAWMTAANRFLTLEDISGALYCLKKGFEAKPSPEIEEKMLHLSMLLLEMNSKTEDTPERSEQDSFYSELNDLRVKLLDTPGSRGLAGSIKKILLAPPRKTGEKACPNTVSIVIPYYRQLDTIAETLNSLSNQTYRNMEVVLVNDGDSESVLQVFNHFAALNPDIRCRYFFKENTGLADTRNYGVARSTGTYILPLDSDDMIAGIFLEETVKILEEHREFAFVFTETLFWGAKNEIWATCDFDPLLLLQRNLMTCTTLYRREVWEKTGGYNTNMKHGYEDWDFWISAVEKGFRGTNIHLPLFIYRRKSDSMLENRTRYDHLAKEKILENHPSLYRTVTPQVREELTKCIGIIPPVCLRSEQITPVPSKTRPMREKEGASRSKILFVCHDFPPYRYAGAQLYAFHLAQELTELGHDVRVLYPVNCSAREEGEDRTPYRLISTEYEGIPVYQINVDDRAEPFSENPQFCFSNPVVEERFRRLLREEGFHLVHYHLLYRLSAGLPLVTRELGIFSFATLHDYWLLCAMGHLIDTAGRECAGPESPLKCATCLTGFQGQPPSQIIDFFGRRNTAVRAGYDVIDCVLSPSSFLADAHERFALKRPAVLPLGWLPVARTAKKTSPGKIVFGYLGQIIARKGLDLLIEALLGIPETDWELRIHGEIYDRGFFDGIRERIGDHPAIRYLGPYTAKDLPELYSGIDVAIMPSRKENYPLTLLEALSTGTPVIASDVGGVREMMEDGREGLVFPMGDVKMLRERISLLLDDPALIQRMGAAIGPVKTIRDNAREMDILYREVRATSQRVCRG